MSNETINITAVYLSQLLNPGGNEIITGIAHKLKGKTAFKFARIMKRLRDEAKTYADRKNEILEAHGKKKRGTDELETKEDGSVVFKSAAAEKKALKELEDVNTDEFDLMMPPIPLKMKHLEQLNAVEFDFIMPLLADDPDETKPKKKKKKR